MLNDSISEPSSDQAGPGEASSIQRSGYIQITPEEKEAIERVNKYYYFLSRARIYENQLYIPTVIISISVIITIFCDAYLNYHVNNKVIIMTSCMCLSVLCSLC